MNDSDGFSTFCFFQRSLTVYFFYFYPTSQTTASAVILSAAALGMVWAVLQFLLISRIPVRSEGVSDSTGLVSGSNDEATTRRLMEIYTAIYEGAESFLRAEYTICAWFILVFSVVIFVLISWGTGWDFARGLFTALSFVLGACTSIREYIMYLSISTRRSMLFQSYTLSGLFYLCLFMYSLWIPWYEGGSLFEC